MKISNGTFAKGFGDLSIDHRILKRTHVFAKDGSPEELRLREINTNTATNTPEQDNTTNIPNEQDKT